MVAIILWKLNQMTWKVKMSEATEDLIGREVDHQEDEDFTAKLKELNLAVNFDAGTNGE